MFVKVMCGGARGDVSAPGLGHTLALLLRPGQASPPPDPHWKNSTSVGEAAREVDSGETTGWFPLPGPPLTPQWNVSTPPFWISQTNTITHTIIETKGHVKIPNTKTN